MFFKATVFKEERHTAENITIGLEATMEEAGINKLFVIITDNTSNMKAAWKILKQSQFVICIKKLEDDGSLLSTAYLEYQHLRTHVRNNTDLPELIRNAIGEFGSNRWQNFLYNPAVIVDYKLNPQYRGNHLNARTFDPIIEKEIIELAGEEYKYIVLTELGKTGDFVGNIIQNLLIGGI
ncbi:hypothetical protein RclHR1_05400003 [Rhizophagus clarus]|uniref:DUF659 domain-containing protein n=1 Tax=Rhizophagus clarus TaxID=94130 RepID=A0A2Z6RNS6_9GLOM|nr:hypothetical protein RclHR1_05400003 [Rhizophagus clarus]